VTASVVERAAEALEQATSDPAAASCVAEEVWDEARRAGDRESASVAARALGLVHRDRRDLGRSSRWFEAARREAERGGHDLRAAEALVSLALNRHLQGRTAHALELLERATQLAPAVAVAAQGQKATILMQVGRFPAALAAFDAALGIAAPGSIDELRLRSNRAVLHCWAGRTDLAEADLRRVQGLALLRDDHAEAAVAEHNLGWVFGRRGDLPAALAALDEAERRYVTLGIGIDELLVDRAELLLRARLVGEAVEAASQATDVLRAGGAFAELAAARVVLAEAQLLAGQPAAARRSADLAARAFAADGRDAWALLARAVALRARTEDAGPSPRLERDLLRTAEELAGAGWSAAALELRLAAARIATDRGDRRGVLAAVDAAREVRRNRRAPADVRVRAWHAEALGRLAADDPRGAEAALAAGLRILEDHRAALGAMELRAHAGVDGRGLAELGIQLAQRSGKPSRVLAWSERQRAQSVRNRSVRPPEDAELATLLAALRAAVADVDEALREGEPVAPALARQRELEQAISKVTRRARGEGGRASVWGLRDERELREALPDGAALVSYISSGGDLLAVVVDTAGVTLHELGPGSAAAVAAEVDAVAFALRRLGRTGVPERSVVAARAAVEHAGRALDELLLQPFRRRVDDRPLLIVPTGGLHPLAWAAMPALRDRPFVVEPSASVWLEGRLRGEARSGRVVAVAGPGLRAADAEAAAVAALHPGAVLLDEDAASARAVLRATEGARLAHFATHGSFRGDNPLFSSLRLSDGPLLVHDLGRLQAAPAAVVLSACDSAVSGLAGGDDLLGLAAALFALGTSDVVASVVPVPDQATARLMVDLHAHLATGTAPAEALARARAAALHRNGGDDVVAALAFQAYGQGFTSV